MGNVIPFRTSKARMGTSYASAGKTRRKPIPDRMVLLNQFQTRHFGSRTSGEREVLELPQWKWIKQTARIASDERLIPDTVRVVLPGDELTVCIQKYRRALFVYTRIVMGRGCDRPLEQYLQMCLQERLEDARKLVERDKTELQMLIEKAERRQWSPKRIHARIREMENRLEERERTLQPGRLMNILNFGKRMHGPKNASLFRQRFERAWKAWLDQQANREREEIKKKLVNGAMDGQYLKDELPRGYRAVRILTEYNGLRPVFLIISHAPDGSSIRIHSVTDARSYHQKRRRRIRSQKPQQYYNAPQRKYKSRVG